MRRIPDDLRTAILRRWIAGDTYRKIRREFGVSLATTSQIKEDAKKKIPELEDLRKLNILLKKSDINFYDTFRGANLLNKLNGCGVSLNELDKFIKLIETLFSGKNSRKEDTMEAAIKLMDLEEKTGKSYLELIKDFEKKRFKIPRLGTKINHLKVEEQAKKVQISKLKKSLESLRKENKGLHNQKNRLTDDISALSGVRSVLKEGIFHVTCKHCGFYYIPISVPTKEDCVRLIKNCKGIAVGCPNCGNTNLFHPQEIAARIGWVLLPEDVVVSFST